MSVRINFEIPIVTSGRTRRGKTLRVLIAYLTTAIDVARIDPEEAPIAATVKNRELRVFGGECFRRLGERPPTSDLLRIEIDTMEWDLLPVTDFRRNLHELNDKISLRSKTLEHPAGIADFSSLNILELDHELVERQLDAFASRSDWWMIVDDLLYYKVQEPLICIEVQRNHGFRKQLTYCLDVADYIVEHQLRHYWRTPVGIYSLADLDKVLARAEHLVTNNGYETEPFDIPATVSRPDLFESNTLALNAAAFAVLFLDQFYEARTRGFGRDRLPEIIEIGIERFRLVSKLNEELTRFFDSRSTTPLLDAVTSILDLPDGDPIWTGYPAHRLEQRDFVRSCLDNEPITVDFTSRE